LLEAIRPNLFKLEIPLPNNPLRALNCYVVVAAERNLIIDTGMNRHECREAMQKGLKELDVDLSNTDFFITHMHADHSGLISYLATDNSKVYCSKPDADVINSKGNWEEMLSYAHLNGFPEDESAIAKHPGFRYGNQTPVDFSIVSEGSTITVGDYIFECVETPGHTKGHLCLYEPHKKLFIAGDHILYTITPNISLWSDNGDPLSDYMQSLDKIYNFDIELVLPAHRRLFADHHQRINELKQHHNRRADEIVSVLVKGSQNAFQIASQIKWDLSYQHWDQFPTPQKWFATGEVIAHLRYLEQKGIVGRAKEEEKLIFYRI